MKITPQPLEDIFGRFAAIPHLQVVLVILFVVFFLVASNAVFAIHYRRVGKPVIRSLFNPASFPLFNFNAREWLLLLVVCLVSFAIGIVAVLSGYPAEA